MEENTSPRPDEEDVRVSVSLLGFRYDYRACITAALIFVQEWAETRGAEGISVSHGDTAGLSRLPCERLHLEP
ncbi:hypothetical protein [Nocardia sp. NPDC004860]|uniref:hypothetical protein n=1 Tax=Nocardia sp. NPDC004860 TaxID=3154557 RepID=UPI0033A8C575